MGRQVLELRSEKFRELQKEALKQPGIVSAELMGRGVRLALAAGQPTEAALAGLRGQGLSFEAGAPESPSLEDLFIDLVQQSRTQEA
jgi:hypothetical protein